MSDDVGGGGKRQISSSKWKRASALIANVNVDRMDEGGEGPKIKYRKIKYLSTL